MPTTSPFGLRYPAGTDFVKDGATAIQNLANDVKALPWCTSGVIASRPTSSPGTPGIFGREYYATDEGCLYFDYGTGWLEKGWLLTPAAKVNCTSGSTSVSNSGNTTLPVNNVIYDQAFTQTGSNRLTCKKAGLYRFGAILGWNSTFDDGGTATLNIFKNGFAFSPAELVTVQAASASGAPKHAIHSEARLALNDYLEVVVSQNNAAAKSATVLDFYMSRVGA